jgi:hypothetical protein
MPNGTNLRSAAAMLKIRLAPVSKHLSPKISLFRIKSIVTYDFTKSAIFQTPHRIWVSDLLQIVS